MSAQFVTDGATNTLSNVTNTLAVNVTVGTNGSFTLLTLSDNTLVTNLANVVIGATASARSNELQLVSATARWQMGGSTFVGSNGAASRLVVSNGALLVNNGDGYVGFRAATSNNVALVTGAGSVWRAGGQVSVGQLGMRSQLILTNGGQVLSTEGRIGSVGSNNLAVVTGSGSQWSNQTDFYVGVSGSGNRLQIENGGLLGNGAGYIGANDTSQSNEVVVTGAGSLWSNRLDLQIGQNGAFNRLTLSNGGSVVNGNGSVGVNAIATSNEVVVTGANSTWSNRLDLTIGSLGSRNQLQVSAGGLVIAANGSLGQNATANANTAKITDTGSEWRFSGGFNVGSGGSSNQLLVSGGARVSDRSGIIGGTASGSNNSAIVSGPGSLWKNSSDFTVGLFGERSVLVISNGGTVAASSGGVGDSGPHNLAVVTGSGSTWSNDFNLNVGYFGHSNRVRIENGALLISGRALIGNTGRSNEVSVTGTGSLWNNPGDLTVGFSGRLNQLLVSDGATALTGGDARVGDTDVGLSNAVVAGGPGARWLVASNLYVGNSGSFNRLVVSNGGFVTNFTGTIGSQPAASSNEATVTGTGSLLSSSTLSVGRAGSGNRLAVNNGGTCSISNVVVGEFPESTNNRVIVDGGTLRVTNEAGTGLLDVRRGTNALKAGLMDVDRLILTNTAGRFELLGGTLLSRGAFINNGASMNVGQSGGGSAFWDVRPGLSNHFIAASLFIGNASSSNQMLITNGAVLSNSLDAAIGAELGADFNAVILSGAGSQWQVGGVCRVGSSGGDNNRLELNNGATLSAPTVVVGGGAGLRNRLVVNGGTLLAPNSLLVGFGTNQLNSGLIDVGNLDVLDAGTFQFNGGTLRSDRITISNGRVFTVGNGSSAATLALLGVFGHHSFSNGLVIANNARLTGPGTVFGPIALAGGGTLSPGDGLGTLFLTQTPSLAGTIVMEVFKLGSTRISDHLIVEDTLLYNGSLIVSNVGVASFGAGDRFLLFDGVNYGGTFTSLTLPPLSPGLAWLDNLSFDGSIEVVAVSVSEPKFSSIIRSGTNLIFSGTNGTAGQNYAVLSATNITTPATHWQSLVTNQFSADGQFSFTNGINPNEPQRFFRIRSP